MSDENASPDEKNLSRAAAARFGHAIQVRRAMLQMKRKELAERAELSYPYVSEIEKGTKEPSAKSLRQLAAALGFHSPAELMAWVETSDQAAPPDDGGRITSAASPDAPVVERGVGLATTWGPPGGRRPRPAVLHDDLSDAVELAVRRALDGMVDDLRREILRIVEAEVARRLADNGDRW